MALAMVYRHRKCNWYGFSHNTNPTYCSTDSQQPAVIRTRPRCHESKPNAAPQGLPRIIRPHPQTNIHAPNDQLNSKFGFPL